MTAPLLAHQHVLVTGSSQGIGLGVGQAMLAAGAFVVFHSEKPLQDCEMLREWLPGHSQAAYVAANLLHPGEPTRLVQVAAEAAGGLHVLINNAGTFREPAFEQIQYEDFERILRLNVWSALEATQAFVAINKRLGRGGRILFSSSLNATRSEPGHTLYDASKGALEGLVRQLAIELAPAGFTTAAVSPGLIETPLTDFGLRSSPAERQRITGQIPLQRMGTTADVAAWYVFLASDAARYATGICIPVDGGLNAQQMPDRPITAQETQAAMQVEPLPITAR
jgi:glucose 1-dehydrogenase